MGNLRSTIKETTVQLRVTFQQKKLLNQAAKLRQTTLSSFVIDNAFQAAQQVLAEQAHFILSPEDWLNFSQMLDAPPKFIPKLYSLLNEPSVLDD